MKTLFSSLFLTFSLSMTMVATAQNDSITGRWILQSDDGVMWDFTETGGKVAATSKFSYRQSSGKMVVVNYDCSGSRSKDRVDLDCTYTSDGAPLKANMILIIKDGRTMVRENVSVPVVLLREDATRKM